jgi:hypothetical protein
MNPVIRYSTSLMDIILGAIGAFFFLLIILSTSRRGLVTEGIQLPKSMLVFNVNKPEELKGEIGKSIHYFIGIANPNNPNEIEQIFFSDIANDENIDNRDSPFLEIRDNSPLDIVYLQLSNDNPPPFIVGVWLQDVLARVKNEELSIGINVRCRKFHDNNSCAEFKLEPKKNYFCAVHLNTGKEMDRLQLRYKGQPLVKSGVLQRQGECKRIILDKKEQKRAGAFSIPVGKGDNEMRIYAFFDDPFVHEEMSNIDTRNRYYKEFGYCKSKDKEIDFHFIGSFNHQLEIDECEKLKEVLTTMQVNIPNTTYLAVGYRAVCAVINDGSLLFQILDDYQYSWSGQSYPFKQQYIVSQNNKSKIPKDTVNKIIRKMRHVEPEKLSESNYTNEQVACMLAEIIAGPNNRKPPYPVVRQNPLLWDLQ